MTPYGRARLKPTLFLVLLLILLLLSPRIFADHTTITVTVCNGSDCGPTPDVTSPTVPTNLVATPISTSQINLSWDASTDPVVNGAETSGVAGYNIYRDGGDSPLTSVSGNSFSDTGLLTSTLYTYTVSAFDHAGNESNQSGGVATTTLSNPTNAPNPSNGAPSGTLASGTTQVTLLLSTDINATCKYGVVANVSYSSEPNAFSTTGGTSHSTVVTGLSDGNTYTYYVRCASSFGVPMTGDYSISFAIASPSSGGGGGVGGGGGGGSSSSNFGPASADILLSGRAYPNSTVTVLEDAQVVASTNAGADGTFSASVNGISAGNYIFSVYGEDATGVRSSLYTFPISVTSSVTTGVSGIFIAPTLSADKTEVKQGDPITFFGQTFPGSQVTISINSSVEEFAQTMADKNGIYQYSFNTAPLEMGSHSAKDEAATTSEVSSYGASVAFSVGDTNVLRKNNANLGKADLNNDGKVNLVDFSILDYWYHRANPPTSVLLDGAATVDLADFSILAFYWTG